MRGRPDLVLPGRAEPASPATNGRLAWGTSALTCSHRVTVDSSRSRGAGRILPILCSIGLLPDLTEHSALKILERSDRELESERLDPVDVEVDIVWCSDLASGVSALVRARLLHKG